MRSQANRGKALEELITIRNQLYERDGIAVIRKIPTEWLPIRDCTGKIVSAKVERKATVDFLGNYRGCPVAFDAKHTQKQRISWRRLEEHQWEFLLKWEACGGLAFVLVGWDMKLFYTVPIQEWGRKGKSLLLTDMEPVPSRGELPDYLRVLNAEIKAVTKEEATKIIDTREPQGKFFLCEGNMYVGIDNIDGNAWTEEFKERTECFRWLIRM